MLDRLSIKKRVKKLDSKTWILNDRGDRIRTLGGANTLDIYAESEN